MGNIENCDSLLLSTHGFNEAKRQVRSLLAKTPDMNFPSFFLNERFTKLVSFFKSLKYYYSIEGFDYYLIEPNNKGIIFSSLPRTLQYYYEEKYYPFLWSHDPSLKTIKSGWITWGLSRSIYSEIQTYIYNEYLDSFNIEHGFSWFQNHTNGGFEYLSLYSPDSISIYQYTWKELMNIIRHFYQVFSKDIQSMPKSKIDLSHNPWTREIIVPPVIHRADKKPNTPMQFVLEKYYLQGPFQGVYLTRREVECLYWLSQGKSAEETAIILFISKRTIEKHFENIKLKLDCRNKYQLIKLAIEQNLF